MPLVKEDGSGVDNANAYADVTEGTAYAGERLNSTAWTGATDGNKAIALIMATRTIDRMFAFNGFKADAEQSLQWPRVDCPNPDVNQAYVVALSRDMSGNNFPDDAIPQILKDATCELAISLLTADRATDPEGKGIKRFELFEVVTVDFDKNDRPAVIPDMVQIYLSKLGRYLDGHGGNVKLTRV